MKLSMFKKTIWAGLCIVVGLITAACDTAVKSKKLPPEAASTARLDWNRKTLVEAYQKARHANPKWDEPALRVLDEFARVRGRSVASNENWGVIISNNCVAAVNAGCDDPMIHYLYVRLAMDPASTKQAFVDAFCQGAVAMEQSSYPAIRKFYAWQRAAEQLRYAYDVTSSNFPPEYARLEAWRHAETNLLNALADKTIPPDEAYDAAHEFLEVFKYSRDYYSFHYHAVETLLHPDWAGNPVILLLKGEGEINLGWAGRGFGFANTITSAGAQSFETHLAVAEKNLTNAWRLNPNDARIALKMIEVELGQGEGRERMELWFNRAMALNPDYYDACNYKLLYLEPKWYGSAEDMLAFGRECATNRKWGGHIPLLLRDAHRAIQRQYVAESEKAGYWHRPEVWRDLKMAFDRFFELNPREIGWYHDYAWYANQAGDWKVLNRLIPKLGPVNYEFFGGKDEFEKMVAAAKEHSADGK